MLEFAKLCDYLTPTTLAQIINDLDDAVGLPPCSDLDVVAMRKVAADALDANIGEHDAAVLIERAKRS
jgi:hypothetical protein